MPEVSYRENPRPVPQSCTKCGAPTELARMVYSKQGDPICLGCEGAADGDERLKRGIVGAVGAAYVLGAIGTVALWALVSSLGAADFADTHHSGGVTYYRGSAWRMQAQLTTGWAMFLGLVIAIAAGTIAGAHRTLGAPAARKLLGPKRRWYLAASWAGIPSVPVAVVAFFALFALAAMLR